MEVPQERERPEPQVAHPPHLLPHLLPQDLAPRVVRRRAVRWPAQLAPRT